MTETNRPTREIWRGELNGDPYWHDEGANTVRIRPSEDGGVHFWVTEWGCEAGPRLGREEARDIAAHLLRLCDQIDEQRGERSDVRTEQQWCVWYGGPDPNNAAGVETRDDEQDAREALEWLRSDHGSGVAVRDLTVWPWRAVDGGEVSA